MVITSQTTVWDINAVRGDVEIQAWSQRFDLLSDPNRFEILLCPHRCPGIGIGIGDLAAAVGRGENAIWQALRPPGAGFIRR